MQLSALTLRKIMVYYDNMLYGDLVLGPLLALFELLHLLREGSGNNYISSLSFPIMLWYVVINFRCGS